MKYILAASFCFFLLSAKAQKKAQGFDYKTAINISPLAIADVDNGLMFGAEYRINPRIALLVDASYLFDSYYFSQPKHVSGFTVRPILRHYINNNEKQGFIQIQSFYKQVDYTLHDWVDKNLVDNVPSYSQLQDFNYRKKVWGFNFMGGFLKSLSSDRFFLDFAGGLGFRYKKQGTTEPNTGIRQRRVFDNSSDGVPMLSLPVSIKLAYRLK